ncbi:lactoylglutathione lyase [Vibrio ishigakensis]|uniref:Lactoylglutathione lyase n=1 Tax=Vibrio ishigakensis TaxID=1481914 RepID=A0A0B8P7J6_9VIBR|nr:VOC family protein [Vibrio ishigakensis]GAM58874.1 lactoylglutathione lyase [Vibrio ishigakensis]
MRPLEILGLDHVVLRTTDLERMLLFYRDILGCPLERQLVEEGLTQLRAGNALIDLVEVDSRLGRLGGKPPQQSGRNVDHFCLQVKAVEVDVLVAYLKEQDVELLLDAVRYGATGYGWSLYVHDPERNVVELKPVGNPIGNPVGD